MTICSIRQVVQLTNILRPNFQFVDYKYLVLKYHAMTSKWIVKGAYMYTWCNNERIHIHVHIRSRRQKLGDMCQAEYTHSRIGSDHSHFIHT